MGPSKWYIKIDYYNTTTIYDYYYPYLKNIHIFWEIKHDINHMCVCVYIYI